MRRNAELILGAQISPLPCVILDLSHSGARLAVSSPSANLPRHFTLILFKDGSLQRDCEIVWSDRHYAGVRFVSEWYGAVQDNSDQDKLAPAIAESPIDEDHPAKAMTKIYELLARSRRLMRDGDFKGAESTMRVAIRLRREQATATTADARR
jgi:PilZ domain